VDTDNDNKKHLFMFKLIWSAVVAFLALHFVVLQVLSQTQAPATEADLSNVDQMLIPLTCVSVIMLVAAILLPPIIWKSANKNLMQSENPQNRIKSYFVPFLMRLLLTESVSIYGLILSLTSSSPTYFLYFSVPVVIVFMLSFPRLDTLKKIAGDCS